MGTQGVVTGRSGSVTFVQRFGSAADLNLHAHAIVLQALGGRRKLRMNIRPIA